MKYKKGMETLSAEQLRPFLTFDLARGLIGWCELSDLVSPEDHLMILKPAFDALNRVFGLPLPTVMDLVRMIFIEKNLTANDPDMDTGLYRDILFKLIRDNHGEDQSTRYRSTGSEHDTA